MGQVVLELYSPYPQWNLEEGRHTAQESGNKTRNAPIGMFLDSSDFFFFFLSLTCRFQLSEKDLCSVYQYIQEVSCGR